MRGKILLSALEILEGVVLSQVDFIEAVLTAGYGASMGKIDYKYSKIQREREKARWRERELEERRKRLRNYIYQMKRDGLIEETPKKNLKITGKGKEKIEKLKTGLPNPYYLVQSCDNLVIASFDIPEDLRSKRDWLREVLRNQGFKMIHKSLWVGKRKVPEDLVNDLERLKILEYVEIFEVTKSGTLKKM